MTNISCFSDADLQGACKVLGDTNTGLTGSEIGHILADMRMSDPGSTFTKWKRIFNALAEAQNKHQVGNHLIMFINRTMKPVGYLGKEELFDIRRDGLNVILSFSGYAVSESGQVVHTKRETTLSGAKFRASRLKQKLEARDAHEEVLKYSKEELLHDNYFHAVLEAIKGIAERVRNLSGLTCDGADLFSQAFTVKAPILKLNTLTTETEISEQKGIVNLLIGLFGAIRNPTAHAPKIVWGMPEQDALDILGIVSYIHRKLDGVSKA